MSILKAAGSASAPVITPSSGTGLTVNVGGAPTRSVYKITVGFAALAAAALTADATIATIPAKTRLAGIIVDCTQIFTGGTIATSTIQVGKTVGGAEYMAAFSVFTAPSTKGLVDADLGTSMVRAAAVQGGDLPNWAGTTAVSMRLTTTVGNTNAATQGSVTVYLITDTHP